MEMTSHKKLGMYFFVASDAMTFGALLIAYSYLQSAGEVSLALGTAMTVVLLVSSLTMLSAVKAANNGDRRRASLYLISTMLGGIAFLMLHLHEWRVLIHHGSRLNRDPFFTVTGFHMAHVAAGVLYLAYVGHRFARAHSTADDVAVSGIYWYFVDVVWMFLFAFVYF
jgi:heme/copper-type cytochrome/quinol oxidase subunit 3